VQGSVKRRWNDKMLDSAASIIELRRLAIKMAYILAMLPRRRPGLLRVKHHLCCKQLSPVVLVGSELLAGK
jgi:hypothetical protein